MSASYEFVDQYLTPIEYARIIGKSPCQVRVMARDFVFADFGIPIISIPRGNSRRGRYRSIYIFYPASRRS